MIFISPVGVASEGTPWVVRRSAFVTRMTSGIGGDRKVGGSNPARPFGIFLVRFQSSFSRSSSSFNK